MALGQVLGGKGGAEVTVAPMHQTQVMIAQARLDGAVAGDAPAPGNDTGRALGAHRSRQALIWRTDSSGHRTASACLIVRLSTCSMTA